MMGLNHFRVWLLLFAINRAIARKPADLWEDMKVASSDNILSNIFYDEQNLLDAYEFEEKLGSFRDESYRISCLDYSAGATFAKKFRDDVKSKNFFTPYRVNKAANLSCFVDTSYANKQLTKEISFKKSVTLPAPLKIHTSVYRLVETGGVFQFHAPVANHGIRIIHSGLSKAAIATFLNETIQGYDVAHFDTFYWSREEPASSLRGETLLELANATPSHARKFAWKDSKKRISDLSARQTSRPWSPFSFWSAPHASSNNDPCGFQQGFADRSDAGVDNLVFSTDKLIASNNSQLISSCIAHLASAFAQVPQVRLVAFSGLPMMFNMRARPIEIASSLNIQSSSSDFFANLRGDNVIVSIADSGVDERSCFFADYDRGLIARGSINDPVLDLSQRKIVQYSIVDGYGDGSDESNGHGSHVAGTILGNTGTTGLDAYNGIASNAKLIVMDCASGSGGGLYPPSPADMYANSFNAGGSIHSNSWGSLFSSDGFYSNAETDKFLYDNPTFVVMFAAGNFASAGAGSVSMEASAKNVVSVASSDTTFNSNSIDDMSYFSSMGPTFDGRINPDITAPGNAIESVLADANGPSCQTVAKSGTSMSSPAVAAAAALISQYFNDESFWASSCDTSYYNCKAFKPSGVLLKAVILHSGTQMASRGLPPDNVQGYGRVHLQSALPAGADAAFKLYCEDLTEIQSGGEILYNIAVGGTGPLKATLVWYDPPSIEGSTAHLLIHDLDLTATAPDGSTFYGNGNTNGNSRDSVNVNEQIFISQPNEGMWTFKVQAGQLTYADSQQFSIVITFAAIGSGQADDDLSQRVAVEEALPSGLHPQVMEEVASEEPSPEV